MKKVLLCSIFLILCIGLTGCTLFNAWLIKGDGKNLKGGYEMASGEAGKVDVIFGRSLLITTQKVNKEFMQSLPAVKVVVDTDNKTKSVVIGKQEPIKEDKESEASK